MDALALERRRKLAGWFAQSGVPEWLLDADGGTKGLALAFLRPLVDAQGAWPSYPTAGRLAVLQAYG